MNSTQINFRPRWILFLLLAPFFTAFAFGQSPSERFFKQIYTQQPNSYFPLLEENQGKYEESYGNGYQTRQSFLLVDPYASGKDRFLKSLTAEALKDYLPGVDFFWGEMSCNERVCNGKLPFIGFSDAKGAGLIFPSGYDVFNKGFLDLVARPNLSRQGQQEKYAEALAQLFAQLRRKQPSCQDEILEFSKAKTNWTGGTLNLKMSYDLKCQIGESVEWGAKAFEMDFDFEFKEGKLTGITALVWP